VVATRLGQQKRMDRVVGRIKQAGPKEIAITRLIPGLRIYTSMVAGAVGVPRRRFLLGVLPATVLWVLFYTALGFLFGIPAAHYLNRLQNLAIDGGLLLLLGLVTYFAVRRIPGDRLTALGRVPDLLRLALALVVDLVIVAALITGVEAITRKFLGFNPIAQWAEAAVLVVIVIVIYFLITRFGFGATPGEAMLGTSYLKGRRRSHRVGAVTEPRLEEARRRFRDLGDSTRLEVLNRMLDGPRTLDELVAGTNVPREEALGHLRTLYRIGLVTPEVDGEDPNTRYEIAAPELRDAISRLMALRAAPPPNGSTGALAEGTPAPQLAPPADRPAAPLPKPAAPAPEAVRSPRAQS
jgi:DNA-binding transcriptional ArsR family regulator